MLCMGYSQDNLLLCCVGVCTKFGKEILVSKYNFIMSFIDADVYKQQYSEY